MNIINICEPATGRQARNLLSENLSAAVRPWFIDVLDNEQVQDALAKLNREDSREQALAYLGLECEYYPVA